MRSWAFVLIFLLAFIGYAALTASLRGSMLHALIAAGMAGYIGLPLVIAGVVGWLFGSRMRNWGKLVRPSKLMLLSGALAMGSLLTLVPGRALARSDVKKAKAYGEEIVLALEKYRAEIGIYPTELSSLALEEREPLLWRRAPLAYKAEQTSFVIRFKDPLSFSAEWIRPHDREWVLEEY